MSEFSEKNPIVYSRFGKSSYDSEEKFNPDTFQNMIRTCNIKNLLKGLTGDNSLGNQTRANLNKNKENNTSKKKTNVIYLKA